LAQALALKKRIDMQTMISHFTLLIFMSASLDEVGV
jgi:hypothetical protein